MKNLRLFAPTQLFIQGQWWSMRETQRLQMRQWWEKGGLYDLQREQQGGRVLEKVCEGLGLAGEVVQGQRSVSQNVSLSPPAARR